MKNVKVLLTMFSAYCSIAHAAQGQLISMQTKYFPNNIPASIPLEVVQCCVSDMALDETKKVLFIPEDGVYEFITIIQYGIRDNAAISGDLYYWLEVNGKPMSETTQCVSVPLQTNTSLRRFDSVMPMKAGSQIRAMFSSTSPDIGLLSFASTNSTPSIPSVTMTVFKIGNIVNYY